MGEGNWEVSFACCGYGRGVCSPVAEVNVVAIQAQACKVAICPECIVTSQLRLRLSMPIFFGSQSLSLLFRVIFPLSLLVASWAPFFKLKCMSHVTYVHQENPPKTKSWRPATLFEVNNQCIPAEGDAYRCLSPADPAKPATWLPQTSPNTS